MKKLYELIDKQIKTNEKVIIAIDGPSCSGKSSLGEMLKEKYDATLFHMDSYFLHPSQKTSKRLSESGGNVDYERIQKEIFNNIDNEFIQSNYFNCSTNILEKKDPLKNKNIVIIEGAYSLHRTLYKNYTLKVLLSITKENQYKCILKRNGKEMLERFVNEWIPLEQYYFDTEDLNDRCDIIIKKET